MTDTSAEQQVPAGKPIFSPSGTVKLHHACSACGHVEEIVIQFGGVLAVGQAKEPSRIVTPESLARVARMRG